MHHRYPMLFLRLLLLTAFSLTASPVCAQKAPFPAPAWSELKAAYRYDTKKREVKLEERPNQRAFILHIAFEGPGGDKVTGLFARPKAEGAYPCVLLLHGLTSSKETMAMGLGPSLIAKGYSLLALDAPLHGERKKAGHSPTRPRAIEGIIREGIRDWRAAIDWLGSRKDIRRERIGLLGYSLGAMMGTILSGVDTRVRASVLCVGGNMIRDSLARMPEALRAHSALISPSLYIGHIAPRPILMLNGKQDRLVPASAAKALFRAANEPREQRWYESGHMLPKEALDAGVNWVTGKLSGVREKLPRR